MQAALLKDAGLPIGKAAAIAKLATSETATRVSHQVEPHLYVKEEPSPHNDDTKSYKYAGDAADGAGGDGEGERGGEELQGRKVMFINRTFTKASSLIENYQPPEILTID